MKLVQSLAKSFEGRGVYPIFMVIVGWSYAFIVFTVLIWQFVLYALGVKYYDDDFNQAIGKGICKDEDKYKDK